MKTKKKTAVREALDACKAALAKSETRPSTKRTYDLLGKWQLVDSGYTFIVKSIPDGKLALCRATNDTRCYHVNVSDLETLRARGGLRWLGRR